MSLNLQNRLRTHVTARGGLSRDSDTGEINIPNGAWAMMLEAADEIDALRGALRLMLPHVQFVIARNPGTTPEAQHAYGVAEQLLSR